MNLVHVLSFCFILTCTTKQILIDVQLWLWILCHFVHEELEWKGLAAIWRGLPSRDILHCYIKIVHYTFRFCWICCYFLHHIFCTSLLYFLVQTCYNSIYKMQHTIWFNVTHLTKKCIMRNAAWLQICIDMSFLLDCKAFCVVYHVTYFCTNLMFLLLRVTSLPSGRLSHLPCFTTTRMRSTQPLQSLTKLREDIDKLPHVALTIAKSRCSW
jgi:hypothetical protein